MARKSRQKQEAHYQAILKSKERENEFANFYNNQKFPNDQDTIEQALLAHNVIKSFRENNFGVFDFFNFTQKGFASENDTHNVSRWCETIFPACKINNSSKPDLPSVEIKFKASVGAGQLKQSNGNNRLIRIGNISTEESSFEESSCFKKMSRILITLYDELTGKFHETILFILEQKNEKGELIWYNKFKEDWIFMHNILTNAVAKGERSSNSNIVSTGTKTPNGFLMFHSKGSKNSQSIRLTQKAYTQISGYYDKKITIIN